MILLVVLIILTVFTAYKINSQITGSTTITGEATSVDASLSITVLGAPSLKLIKPENKTYFTDKNLDLIFTAGSALSVWYKIDDLEGDNKITTETFNVSSEGPHTLYLYANNSEETTSRNVTFTVDTTIFSIDYDAFADPATKGDSTDFNKTAYEDLQNLSNVVLENTDYGKIQFNEIINLTNISDNEIDFDTYTNISLNHIEINTTALANFNKSATLSLYNLTFTSPRILRDGSVCPDPICTIINYSGGTLVFNITQFTAYSAEESPEELSEEESTPSSVSTGGGITRTKSFSVNINEISVHLKQGEVATRNIVITNNLNKQLNIIISSQRIENFILIRDSMINLAPGESKSIPIDFIARTTDIPELYLGKIIIKEGGIEEEILVILEVESKDILLDVYAEIPLISKKVLRGEDLFAEIRILNLGAFGGRQDVKIEYKVKDLDGNDIFEEHETIAIETQTSFIKRIHIPEYIEHGNYILYIRAIYDGEVASASARFEVAKSKVALSEKVFIVIFVFLIIIISFLVYYIIIHPKGIIKYLKKRRVKIKKRIGFKDIKK